MVGFTAEIDPSSDTYAIPNASHRASAAELVACAVQTLMDNRVVRDVPEWLQLIVAAVMILGLVLAAGLGKPLQAVIIVAASIVLYFGICVALYRSGWLADFAWTPLGALCAAVPAGALNSYLSSRARQRVIDLFGAMFPGPSSIRWSSDLSSRA